MAASSISKQRPVSERRLYVGNLAKTVDEYVRELSFF
jgi:RNA recognition motif-containing protein